MDNRVVPGLTKAAAFLGRCISVDLEIDPKTSKIFSFAAVRPDIRPAFVHTRGDLHLALSSLDDFADGAEFLLGHNIIHFDIRHLKANAADLRLLTKPVIDTLWLNPLAFPCNPYHHLVKHYQDGRLQAGHINNPELDAELVLTVLQNQITAFGLLQQNDPDIRTAFHWLTAPGTTCLESTRFYFGSGRHSS